MQGERPAVVLLPPWIPHAVEMLPYAIYFLIGESHGQVDHVKK
jgi:hypothetical protein